MGNRNPQAEIQRIQQDFKKFGIHGLQKHDAKNLSLFSSNDQDMVVLHEILTSYFKSSKGDPKMKINCVTNCHRLCYIRKDVTNSRCFTQPPFLKWFDKNPIAILNHLTLLYDEGLYQEVVDTHKLLTQVPNVGVSAIVMASLYKLGTPEAYQEALTMWNEHERLVAKVPEGQDVKTTLQMRSEPHLSPRGIQIFALFCIQEKDYDKAMDALGEQEVNNITDNLFVYKMMKSGELEKAVAEVEFQVKNFKMLNTEIRLIYTTQVINELDLAISQTEKKGLLEKFRNLQELMKSKGFIKDITNEQLILDQYISASPGSSISDEKWGEKFKTHKKQNLDKFTKKNQGRNDTVVFPKRK